MCTDHMMYKPGSVSHKHERMTIHLGVLLPTPSCDIPEDGCMNTDALISKACLPILSCSRWGLPCHLRYRRRGALLPHHFTLTCAVLPRPSAVMLSVPLSVASRRPAVSRHSALRSPDFPPRKHVTRRLSGLLMCVPIITQTGLFLINANWDLPEFNIATQQKRLYLNDAIYCYFFIKIIILFHKNKRKIC